MKIGMIALAVVLIGCITGCTNTTAREHVTLEDQLKRIESVVLLPVDVKIELVTLTGENERLVEREAELAVKLTDIVNASLTEHGFTTVPSDFTETVDDEVDVAYAITQIREGFDQVKKDIDFGRVLPKSKINKMKVTVGEAANIVQSVSGTDAIMMVNYAGFDKSGGHVAKDLATGVLVGVLTMGAVVPVAPKSGAMIEMALIDGASGELLWVNSGGGYLNEKLATHVLKKFPQDVDE